MFSLKHFKNIDKTNVKKTCFYKILRHFQNGF